jgi:lactoylglutathione lyase
VSAGLQLKNVLITAEDMDGLIADFATLSAGVAFRDGDQYAVLDSDSARLGIALAAPNDHPAPGQLVLSAKTDHVQVAVDELVRGGAEVLTPLHRGGHEVRALVRGHSGLLLMIYGPEE